MLFRYINVKPYWSYFALYRRRGAAHRVHRDRFLRLLYWHLAGHSESDSAICCFWKRIQQFSFLLWVWGGGIGFIVLGALLTH